jgi:hypothetical protein
MSETAWAGRTAAALVPAFVALEVGVGAISMTVPNSWHLGQRPTQRKDVAPHALHW